MVFYSQCDSKYFNLTGSDGHGANLTCNFSRISPSSRSLRLPPSRADNEHHPQRLTPPQVDERHSPPNERDSLASPDIISRVSVRLTPPVSPGRPPRDSSGDKHRDSEFWPQRQNRRSPGKIIIFKTCIMIKYVLLLIFKSMDVVSIARLETFRAQKFSRLYSFRVLKSINQNRRFSGPNIIHIGKSRFVFFWFIYYNLKRG